MEEVDHSRKLRFAAPLGYCTLRGQGNRRSEGLSVAAQPETGTTTLSQQPRLVDYRSPVPLRSSLVTFRSTISEPFWSHFS
jgi:hypothetical protein